MIPILVTLAALAVFGPPSIHLKHKKPACPVDTVFIHTWTYQGTSSNYEWSDTLRTKELSPHRSPTR